MGFLPAQCVMCFRTAAAQQAARSAVFNRGILVLLVPPFCVVLLILWMAWRRKTSASPKPAAPKIKIEIY